MTSLRDHELLDTAMITEVTGPSRQRHGSPRARPSSKSRVGGITINSCLALQQNPVLLIGAGMVAIIGLTSDWIGSLMERVHKPRGP